MSILYGALVWGAHFGLLYGFTALACARGFAGVQWLGISVIVWTIAVATALALLAVALIALRGARSARPSGSNSAGVAALAGLGIIWEAVPASFVQACG